MADILFVNSTAALAMKAEANGTMLLATKLLQAGFDVDILRFCQIEHYKTDYPAFIRDAAEKILARGPKCVSFYTLWPFYHIMLRIAAEIKQKNPGVITVFGGPQASFTAAETLSSMDFVDYICTGEGENTVVPFFGALLRGDPDALKEIPGLYFRENGQVRFSNIAPALTDLNTLPYWDDRLYLELFSEPASSLTSGHYSMPIDTGRGCPFNCTFCCTSKFLKRSYRLKSPERIVEDILYYNRKFGITSFCFSHDAFTTNIALVTRVCDLIIEKDLKITWWTTSRIDCLTEELILKMKQAGMTRIDLGIETASPRLQKVINKKLNLEKANDTIAFLRKNKIQVTLFFMYGFPDETEQELNDTLEMFFSTADMGVTQSSMALCRFYPSTQLLREHFDELVLDPEMKKLSRDIFGYEEELPMFRDNKALFPFFYNLDTPLRKKYQYVFFLAHMYQEFPNSMKHLRKLYHGDNLKFYLDFYESNLSCFGKDIASIKRTCAEEPLAMLDNLMKHLDAPCPEQLRALLKYDFNLKKVLKSKEDITVQDTYDFSYVDFKLKLPIEQYSSGQTEILLQKINGKAGMKILRIS